MTSFFAVGRGPGMAAAVSAVEVSKSKPVSRVNQVDGRFASIWLTGRQDHFQPVGKVLL
jgi:hypothetical protein